MKNNNFVYNTLAASKIAHIYIIIASAFLFTYTFNTPIQNWDMLGYAASAASFENTNVDFIHSTVYDQFKRYASEEVYIELTENHSYRQLMSIDPEAFYQQIPFYKIRILFTLLILGLVKIGVNVFSASHFITAAFTCSGILIFYYAFRKHIHPYFWSVVPIFFILFGGHDVARMVTADSLAFLWVGLICYSFLEQRWLAFFALLVLSIFVRTDMLILVILFLFYIFIFKKNLRIASLITLLLAAGAFIFINKYTGNHGWSTVFYYALVSDMMATHPEVYTTYGINITQYLTALFSSLSLFFYDIPTLFFETFVSLQFIILLLIKKSDQTYKSLLNSPMLILTLISITYVLSHYLLFPLLDSRFFVGQYFLTGLILLVSISHLIEKNQIEPANN
jgi:hypothetical protein